MTILAVRWFVTIFFFFAFTDILKKSRLEKKANSEVIAKRFALEANATNLYKFFKKIQFLMENLIWYELFQGLKNCYRFFIQF